MWELDYKESWVQKNWCFWTVVLEKTLESPLDCKEIQSVHSEGDQPWDFFGGNDAKAETPVLWPPDAKNWTHLKTPWCWERLKVGGEGDDRGWDGWMASLTWWTWVWLNSGSWWWTGRPGVLQFMVSQESDTTEQLIWCDLICGPSVIRLTSFLWLWFQCVCPLMPSCNTYHLTWVYLTLGVGYLFMAAPAKCIQCSLPWMRGIS